MNVEHFYRLEESDLEYCFNVEVSEALSSEEIKTLSWLLAETFAPKKFGRDSFLRNSPFKEIIEIGPLLNYATPWNTNALSICRACGLTKITRLERSTRRIIEFNDDTAKLLDRMTQGFYLKPLESFDTGHIPEKVYSVPLIAEGPNALLKLSGLSMDEADRQFYYHYFAEIERRDPTIVEIMDLNNANSEHCRHGYFKGKQIIDGVVMPETLMDIVKSTLEANPGNSLVAFNDNSSAIRGYNVWALIPEHPGQSSAFVKKQMTYHLIFTAETHNFPTGVAPYPGAETGTGGRIRDAKDTGRGSLVVAGTTGYFTGNLFIPGYKLPWEKERVYPKNLASGLEIMIRGSDGASDYGNKFGEPVIVGTAASVAIDLPSGEHQEFIKPILFTGGIGMIDDRHIKKDKAEIGMLIVQVGGPAYRIGFGGGSASSLNQGDNKEDLDFNAVQRGDGEMGQKTNRIVRACVEMGENNPIVIVHDQGAGGPANVLKELVEKYGGKINIRKIVSGDPTLSVLEIWICEYQERSGFIIDKSRIEEFWTICKREKVNCEILGEVTGDGYFVVSDEADGSTPVNLDLKQVLGNLPQKTFIDKSVTRDLAALELPKNLDILEALKRVLRLVSVGSKDHLTAKVDRSVTGLVAQQQCCGPLQLPVADVGVIAQSYFPNNLGEYTGGATAIGEKHMEMIINPRAATRLAITEMLTNMASVKINGLKYIKCSGNWMWAPKLPGEGARLYRAALAVREFMIDLGVAIDGGKDSLSMATKVKHPDGRVETVKSPSQLIISGYASVPDVRKKVTPDIKKPGASRLMRIDLSDGKRRLGGSALAQVYNQPGNETPDVEVKIVKNGFNAMQKMVSGGLILSAHDISKGGFITTLLEMCFAGNCGFYLELDCRHEELIPELFAEEAGWVIEYLPENEGVVVSLLNSFSVPYYYLGKTIKIKEIYIVNDGDFQFLESTAVLRQIWEETSYQLEKLQIKPICAVSKKRNVFNRPGITYKLGFEPKTTLPELFTATDKPKVAIIREEGSNGDREMTAAFYSAGFEPYDVTMTDLLNDRANLRAFQMVAFVGGFSYADVLDSAKGWAGVIRFNEKLRVMFDEFYNRPDTLSLGVCNGCQLEMLLGWVPWKGLSGEEQPRFIKNESGRFESHFLNIRILDSPAVMLKGMADSILGVWSAHGEGKLHFPNHRLLDGAEGVLLNDLAPIRYVNDNGQATRGYPFNPNESPWGIAGLCSQDGRHLAMMPHPERTFLKWQLGYLPEEWKDDEVMPVAPWLQMFQNARKWCEEHRI